MNELATPIYVQLVTLFRRRIETGEWQVGDQIPSLDELAEQVGAARATVRHAIGFLEIEGLIGRYRGRGTFVLEKPKADIWHDIPSDWSASVDQSSSSETKMEWIECRPALRLPNPSHPGGKLAPAYQFLRRLHRRNGIPYLVGSTFVEKELFDRIGKKNFNDAPFRVLQRELGNQIARAEQTIVVGTADLELADYLNVPVNSPIVILNRSVFDQSGVLIYESVGHHRGDLVRIRMKLR
ncbi:GntR family transcriptional regulator [Bradyrhizobium sp. NP1]|uniref:GntR family transcriptional regulator n=1 Tax=Bradyrhizobium sp. NP1 TaxID=3049772 RepID=UPI0025A67AAB|nr:GntR family transcriptional regulator [Bradyrhizobium sp. NP1]WJR75838.1 GntR family transcriptional regulator [Bradyrhizobium sp. NP1]